MIDIHAHILPGLDDGPETMADAVRIVQEAFEEGISTIIATPHTENGVFNPTPEEIIEKCSLLDRELHKRHIPMAIRPGSEIHLTADLIEKYDQGQLLTLNNLGSYILLELPPIFMVNGVINIIQQLRDRGVNPIIAHPERNKTIIKCSDILQELYWHDALLQVTATSLVGGFGKTVMNLTEEMIEREMVSYIASDIHPFRDFLMSKAMHKVQRTAGAKTAEILFKENQEEILYFSPSHVQTQHNYSHPT